MHNVYIQDNYFFLCLIYLVLIYGIISINMLTFIMKCTLFFIKIIRKFTLLLENEFSRTQISTNEAH